MKKYLLALLVALCACATFSAPAEARIYGRIGIDCCGYYPYYSPYYYGYPTYYAPPAVVYAEPPPVTYVAPQPQTVIVQQPQAQAAPQQPVQTAPAPASKAKTFTDSQGRTCRKFETIVDGDSVGGTACLQDDGTWRTVNE